MTSLQYELWDMESANRLGVFDSQHDAMKLVQEIFDDYGRSAVESLALGTIRYDDDDSIDRGPVIDGEGLLSLVQGSAANGDEPSVGSHEVRGRRAAS